MENKQKGMKEKLILLGGLIAIIIAVIVAVVVVNINKQKENFAKANPELAKAMEYDEVQDGEEDVDGTDGHVKFDAFFLRDINQDGYAESIRGTSKEIGKEDTLYMELNVLTAGCLKDAKITINDGNFYFQTSLPKDDELKDNYIGSNIRTIEFNQLNNGTQKMLTGAVKASVGNNINNYSKVDSVTLTGTYVTEDNQEIPITKTVNFNIDWYGTAKATIYTSSSYNSYSDLDTRIDEENGTITLDFSVRTEETKNELILKDNHVEVTIPQLNGYDPISVTYTGSNATANYDAETKTLTIDRESFVGEDGTVTRGISNSNSYNVRVVYPIEAYQAIGEDTVTIKIPVSTYYEGYNNQSEEFTNPYKSNTATATLVANYKNPTGSVARFDVTVGKNLYSPSSRYVISKQKPLRIYNGVSDSETDDTYQVRWYAYTGTDGAASGIVMKETENGKAQVVDNFIKTDSSKDSMENVTTNIGIAFSEVDSILKEDGWIKVYDEDTGDLLVTFTKADWNKYTANNPYKYELPVKHIRVETSETNANSSFYVYNIKELDDDYITTNYSREAFDNLQYIQSTLVGYLGGTYINTDTYQAHYEAPYSIADIGISNNTISTQITEKNEKLTITARYDSSSNQVGWVDGSFVVKLPEEIIDAQINDVQINNSAVSITSYELVEQDGVKLIKINTKNNNDTPQTYSITVDVDITPDPRVATVSRNIELYATNEEACDYYYNANDIYDVNDNLNTEEKVNYDTTSLSMVSPNSLLTNQVGSNYDDKGSQVVSPEVADIKPVYGIVDQEGEEKEATIGVQVRNNYGSTISDIQIVGKIPFEGNTYVISGGDLGSTFTTKMTEAGISVPEDLQEYATVYYSENENPDRDLSNEANGWKTAGEVTNWDNVKTFLIDLGDYVMPTGAEYVFNYTVKIPNGLEFNQVSFSHHGVYFSLDTDQGKYRTQTEPNRLGFRIAEKYNLELTKYQTGKDKVIPGATYSITDEETGESKTAVTTANGTLTINNLYAEKVYLIKEIKTPSDYELNSDVIRFIGHVDNEGNLTIEKTSGTTKEDIQVIKEEGQDYKVSVKVEDEVKASIKIHKTEQGTDTNIQNVRYKLTGYNLSENGRTVTTNSNGEATISGLSINQEYTLTETKAEGYYLANPIKFKIVNNDGNYTIETTEGTIKGQETTEEDSIPTITLNIEDEKIPTYSLQIIKVKKTTESTVSDDELVAKAETALADTEVTYLEGAKFKLYKNDEEIGEYITDGNGTVTIDNLYQYIDGKDEDAIYTLKEVLAPEGYAKVKDIRFKVENKDNTLSLLNIDGTEEKYTVEGTTVKLTIEDSPSFKLIKKDAETQLPIANVKFAIYNVDDGEVPATNSKGEIIGTKETINGKEYYTVQTDENGELTADLTEGLYKAVEVQAPDQYDIENQTYYFGIGASREAPEGVVVTQAQSFGGSSYDYINSIAETSDGGYIAGGYFQSDSIQVGNETLTNNGSTDGLIIKYSSEGEVEWAKSFGGSNYDEIQSVAATSDGGAIAGGYFRSSSIQVGNETLTNNGSNDGIIIKYSSAGEVEWAKSIGGSSDDYINSVAATSDGGAIVGGYFSSSEIQVGNETLTYNGDFDGLIIKYSSEGEVEWAKSIGGSSNDYIYSVAATSDGGAIVGGYFSSSEIQVGNETLTYNGDFDGLIIKYSSEGVVEWAKSFGGSNNDYIESVAATSDGGAIVGGYFKSSTIQVGTETLTSNGSFDGLIIKYNADGVVEWAKNIGGSSYDCIESIAETSDGGYIAGGYFESKTIQVGKETLTNNGSTDGLIIKYSSSGEVEWAKSIGGSSNNLINSVAATSDGGILAGGYFEGTIQVGNETLTNNGDNDGLIIKYEMQELANPVVTNATSFGGSSYEKILSVVATSDGGILAGGYFEGTIQVGNETLKSNGYSDGLIIKYSSEGEVEWVKSFGGSRDDQINSVAATSDGEYIVGGDFESKTIQVGDETLTNNSSYSYDGLIIKYSSSGEVEWAKSFGGSSNNLINSVAATSDGGAIAGGYFRSSSIQVGNETLTNNGSNDGIIIKYSSAGEVEWAKSIGGSSDDYINSVATTSDGGIIAGGYFLSSTIQVGDETLTNNRSDYVDGLIIKYSSSGEVEWAKSFGESSHDYIKSVSATSDGGVIAGGYFRSSSIQVGNETLTNKGNYDGVIIKYSSSGEVEWAKSFGGNSEDSISSIAATSDGGAIAGGYFYSSTIQVGNETLKSNGYSDGLIIKYNSSGDVEWAKNIGGSSYDYIQSVTETNDGRAIAGGYFQSSTIEVDGHTLTNNGSSDGMILEVVNQVGVPEVQELTVENSRKEFKITTDVKEIDGVKGGSISGEGMNPYEKVKYGENSTKQIVMTPDENYEIIGITVNGEEWPFEANEDGTYTMPQFTNMTEDKHVEVTYSLKDNKIIINKVDSEDNSKKLAGATFKLDQIEERTEPNNEEIIGEITANGTEYVEADTEKGEVTGVLGDLTNNGTYYFVQNEDGTLTPTNSKTYQTAHEGTAGIQSSTANSYIPINLSDKEGEYVVVVNARVSSESADYGYATVNQSTTAPSRSTTTGRFMYISGTSSSVTTAKDYTSTIVLQGGQTYYLHLGYYKDSSIDSGEDQVVINSIKVYGTNSSTYNFGDNGSGGYESNNQGQDSTTANSYIPIDLRSYTGKYNLVVNANVSSESYDYGYATVNTSTTAPAYSSSTGRFIYISGTDEEDTTPTDYTTVLQGGQMYYLHLGYYKNASTSSGDDKFTVNSVKVTLNDSELYHSEEITTNSEGQAITQIPFGKYQITEVKAPEGYELNTEPTIVEFRADGNHEFTIENKQLGKVIVHHYLKTNDGEYTTTPVAEDELQEGKDGDSYTTSPKLDLDKYQLEKDEDGNYVIPEKATGNFESGKTIEVIYYYETKDIPLTVHHYIEGTTEKVPLKDGGVAEDVTDSGKEGESYTTSPIEDSNLSDDYELVETPVNSTGTYSGEEVVVTYYYKRVSRPVVINKYDEDGSLPLAGVKFTIAAKETPQTIIGTFTTDSNGKITTNLESGDYIATETAVPEGYDLPSNPTTEFSVTKDKDQVTLDITNTKTKGTVITHHYIEGTTDKVPSNVEGQVVEDVVQTGNVGDIYATKEAENVNEDYEFVSTEGETSGTIQNGTIEVIYYYKAIDTNLNIPVSKVWDDNDNKLGQRPTKVTFKLTGSDGSEHTLELAKPGTEGSTTTQDSNNPNKWNDIFVGLPKYDDNKQEIVYTLTEVQGDMSYYEATVDEEGRNVTNTNKYGKVTVHHYIMNPDGSTTETRVPDINNTEIPDEIIEGKEGDPYETEPADNVSDKYELVQEKLPEKPNGTIEKYNEEKPQEVIYYYRLKPAKVIIHYLEKDEDSDDSNNVVLSENEQINGHVDDKYNTDTEHKKDTISYNGKTYTLVSNSGNTEGTMTVEDTNVTYYYLQNTKATVRYVARDPVTHEEIKDLEAPYTEEGLVGDEFVTNSKEFPGYKLVESPVQTTIKMTKDEQTLIYYYEPIKTGLLENHIDDKTGKILYTEEHNVQVGEDYNIPSKNFEGYDLVTSKLPNNATGTMGEEYVTVNYYYIKKAVLEVNYIDKETGEPLAPQITDDTKHEGDSYTTEQKQFENYDLVEVPSNWEGTMKVETDDEGNITNNRTVVTYYYSKRSAGVEEHHIDILTGEELEEPTLHEGHVGDPYDIKSKDFLSYVVATTDKDGNSVLPTNAQGTMQEDKIVVNYYYYQPAKVIVHYVDKTTGKELEEPNPDTGELQSSQVVIEGQNQDDYTTEAKDFEYYKLVESPEEPNGKMKVEITKDENGNDVVNNTIDVYYYYEPKPFNIGVEKEVTGIIVNGNRRSATNGKLEKVDIYRKSTENTSVQVEYKIKVMNTGEVSGRAIIEDKLPDGMSLANNDGTWEVKDGTITKVIPEIGAGETKVYTVLLNWRTSGNNMGNKVNEVSLIQTDNVPGFKDGNDKDNMDEATVSISVETGEFPVGLLIVLVALVGLETVTLRYAVVLTKRQKKNNKK